MRVTTALALVLTAWCAASPPSLAWSVTKCDKSLEVQWERSKERLRGKKPGEIGYLPHPYPQAPVQTLEDFLYQYREAWETPPEIDLPPADQALLDLLAKDLLTWEVHRVENWTPLSCSPKSRRDFYHLLRFFDGRSGQELARAAVHPDGYLAVMGHAGKTPPTWTSLDKAAESFTQPRFRGSRHQHVAATGTLRCDVLEPCIAWTAGNSLLLLKNNHLYEIFPQRGLSLARDFGARPQKELMERSGDRGELFISLGGDILAPAAIVAKRAPKEPPLQ